MSGSTGVVTVARSRAEVEALRPLWADLPLTDADADLDFYLAVVAASADTVPHVVRLDHPDGRSLLAVGRIATMKFPLRVGYRTLPVTSARALLISFGGLLGCAGPADARELVAAVRSSLVGARVDVVVVQKTERGGHTDTACASLPRLRRHTSRPVTLWRADLPDSWDALLAARSAKSRKQLRYDDKKVERRLGSRLAVVRLHEPAHHHRALADMEAVASRSYQEGLGVSLAQDPVQRALLETSRDRGWFRSWMVYVDDRPAAFWWGVVTQRVLTIMSPGFDPAFSEARLGYYALRRMLADSCADPEVDTISFGPGDAEYKARFGTESVELVDVMIFSPTARGAAVGLVVRLNDVLDRAGRWVIARSGRGQDIRRKLRQGLTRGGSGA